MLDSPQTVGSSISFLQKENVSKHSSAAFGLAPIVATSPSTTMSSFPMPIASARLKISRMIPCFSAESFGSPSSESGSKINMAPYFFAIGSRYSIFSFSREMELTSARPG